MSSISKCDTERKIVRVTFCKMFIYARSGRLGRQAAGAFMQMVARPIRPRHGQSLWHELLVYRKEKASH